MTKREMFSAIREVVIDNAEMVEFIDHEIELLNKKSSSPRKPTAKQLENQSLKAEIVDYLMQIAEPICIKDLQAGVPNLAPLTNQRITHLLTDLVKAGEVTKEYVRKTPYYSIAV